MPADLILSGNGPGELSGWIAPVARAARDGGAPVRITLALTPSQFAGGRESEVVRQWDLFDRVLAPAQSLRLALGVSRTDRVTRGVLVHLGGDLWLSGRLAARLRIPACAFAETPLVARRHRPFQRIFAATEQLAAVLRTRGVPAEKILVTGDPRSDAFAPTPPPVRTSGAPVTTFMPGSRDRFFRLLAPFFVEVAWHLTRAVPHLVVRMVTSPFLSPSLVAEIQGRTAARRPALRLEWITAQAPAALAGSDLVVTIPGTNTMELALIGVPFVVVLHQEWIDLVPLEGALEWVGRLPGVGARLKRRVVSQFLQRGGYLALPNREEGRRIVPEWVGSWPPAELATAVADLLRDGAARDRIRADLSAARPAPGASRRIAEQALALA